jgi:hypothetical protein
MTALDFYQNNDFVLALVVEITWYYGFIHTCPGPGGGSITFSHWFWKCRLWEKPDASFPEKFSWHSYDPRPGAICIAERLTEEPCHARYCYQLVFEECKTAFSVLLKDCAPDRQILVLTDHGLGSVSDQWLMVIVVGAEFETILLVLGRPPVGIDVCRKFLASKPVVTLPEDLVGVEV